MGNVQVYFAFLGFLLAIKPTLVRIIDELTMSNPAYFLVPPQELGVYCWISSHLVTRSIPRWTVLFFERERERQTSPFAVGFSLASYTIPNSTSYPRRRQNQIESNVRLSVRYRCDNSGKACLSKEHQTYVSRQRLVLSFPSSSTFHQFHNQSNHIK